MKGFISRSRLAALLDRKTATLGMWDRKHKGVGGRGAIYINERSVVYRLVDAERFVASLGLPPSFVAPQERLAARGADVPRREQGEAGPRSRADARSAVLQEPTASTDEGGHE